MTATKRSTTSQPARPSHREEQKLLTRARIVRAAIDVFFERGYAGGTVDDVAAAAGVGRATFYLHFPNKAALVVEIGQQLMPELERLYGELATLESPTPEGVGAWIDRFVAYYAEQRALVATCMQAETIEPAVSLGFARSIETLVDCLCHAVGAKKTSKATHDRRRSAAFLLVIQLDRFAYYTAVRGWSIHVDASRAALAREWSSFLRSLSR